jgi:hypothetical protein
MNIIFKIIQHLPETDQIVVKFCRQNAPKPIDEYDAVAVNLEYINFNDPVSFSASLAAYGMGMIETQLRSEPILDENKSNIDLNSTNSTNIDDYVDKILEVNFETQVSSYISANNHQLNKINLDL